MEFFDIIYLILLLFASLLIGLAIWNINYKSNICKSCRCSKGYCVFCSNDPYNRSVFHPLIQWIKKHYSYGES